MLLSTEVFSIPYSDAMTTSQMKLQGFFGGGEQL